MAVVVTHSKTLVAPDSGVEDKVYGVDYVAADSHIIAGLSAVAESNQYADLSGLPTLGTAASTLHTNYASSTHGHSASDITTSTFDTARLGTGASNVSTFVDGTGAWSVPVYTSLSGLPTLGTAASTAHTDYATAAQGATADAAQPGDAQLTSLAGLVYAGNALKTIRVLATEDGFELAVASAAVAWGAITGTLGDQTDLQGELDAISSKAAIVTLSSAAYTLATDYATAAHFHAADKITTSTFNLARLGSGTYNASTFLRGTSTFVQPSFSSLADMPTLGTAASTSHLDYASSTHNISSATHTFPGGTTDFLRSDGVFATPPAGASNTSTVVLTTVQSVTTTSSMPVTGLAFTVSNTIAYAFDFRLIFASRISSNGLTMGFTFPAVSTFGAQVNIPFAAAGAGGFFGGMVTSSGGRVTATAVVAASTQYCATACGVIIPSADGTLQLRAGAEVAGQTISSFAGSFGTLTIL